MQRLKAMLTAMLTGALLVGSVWAGIGLAPVDRLTGSSSTDKRSPVTAATLVDGGAGVGTLALPDPSDLGPDELLVGAAKVDIEPRPGDFGGTWVRDKAECTPQGSGDANRTLTHAADWREPWIENTNCIYMGGFGIGPTQPVIEWDSFDATKPAGEPLGYGLWIRSAAFLRPDANGTMRAVVVSIIDGEGYFGQYNRLCPADQKCGLFDLQQQLGTELGLDPASFIFASTHAHSAMDFIGGWGGVPPWYMKQVAQSILASARAAVLSARPATLVVGDTLARGNNGERRDTYYSAEDPSVNWIRATDRLGNGITTVGTYSAHATSFGGSATRAHADWPGVFGKRTEERFGGVGLAFEAGLGNMSNRGGAMTGKTLADLLPATGTAVKNPRVRVAQTFWEQPVTNGPLGSLGAGGFFDRPFGGPAALSVGKSAAKPCVSASAVSVHVSVTAAKIGDVIITAAPGEIFSTFSNTIEEREISTALAIGQANDALGYMPQQFETDYVAREGPGFVGGGFFEYEDAYSIDHCFGEKALDAQLKALASDALK